MKMHIYHSLLIYMNQLFKSFVKNEYAFVLYNSNYNVFQNNINILII